MPLSYNWSTMTTLVNNMTPDGNTNQGIGLAHAWMSLVGGGPYPTPPAKDPNYTYQRCDHPADRRPQHGEPLVLEIRIRSMPGSS